MTSISNPVVVDNTVLSSLAVVARMDLLQLAFGECYVVDAVVDETRNPPWLQNQVSQAIANGWLKKQDVTVTSIPGYAEYLSKYYGELLLGKGESASLAWIRALGTGTLVTDDFAAAGQARSAGVPAVSTLWVLYDQYTAGNLPDALADQLMFTMRQEPRKARFPAFAKGFNDVIEDFRKGEKQRRLY